MQEIEFIILKLFTAEFTINLNIL